MNKLFTFFFSDETHRAKVYLASAAISLAYALINLWVLHRSEERVFSEVIWVLLSSILLLLIVYLVRGRAQVSPPPKFHFWFYALGTASAVLLLMMVNIDMPTFQAYVADAALNHFSVKFDTAEAAALTTDQVQVSVHRIQSIVAASVKNEVPVNPNAVEKTGAALDRYLKQQRATALPPQVQQAGYSTVLDLQAFGYTREAQSGTIATPPISSLTRQVSSQGYVFNSVLEIDQHDQFIRGDHSLFVLGDSIVVSKVTVVFKGVDFEVTGANPPLAVGQGGTLVVIDSIFQGGQQPLDNISWIDVQFRDMQPRYHGGAIRLRNVSFTGFNRDRVQFGLPPDLALLILESGGKPINYVFEPQK
jgi:hypothetical protein